MKATVQFRYTNSPMGTCIYQAYCKLPDRLAEVWADGDSWKAARDNLIARIERGDDPPPDEEVEIL